MAILLSFICPGLGHLFVLLDSARDSNRVKNRDMQRQADLFADAFSRKR